MWNINLRVDRTQICIIDRLDEVPDGIVMYRMANVCYSDGHCSLIFVVGDGFIQEL